MEWVKIIAPLVGVLLGWGLSERAKLWADSRQDKRKLKRLLFYILELRFHFTKELNIHKDIDDFLRKAKVTLKSEFGEEVEDGINMFKPVIQEIINSNLEGDDQFAFLEENIDSVIIDLSEVFPVFAYELSGQHKIKEKLKKSNSYLNGLEELLQEMPFDFKGWLQPKITTELLNDLDNNVKKIASKIDKNTLNEVNEKVRLMDNRDNSDIDGFLNDYILKIKENME